MAPAADRRTRHDAASARGLAALRDGIAHAICPGYGLQLDAGQEGAACAA